MFNMDYDKHGSGINWKIIISGDEQMKVVYRDDANFIQLPSTKGRGGGGLNLIPI